MKYAILIGSGVMLYVQNFKNFKEGYTITQTRRHTGIQTIWKSHKAYFHFCQSKGSRLKCIATFLMTCSQLESFCPLYAILPHILKRSHPSCPISLQQ
jgi:hypothetical protein